MRLPIFVTIWLAAVSVWAGPITSSTALPVNTGEFIFRSQARWLQATGDPTAADRELGVWAVPNTIVHGVNDRWALFGNVPWLDKRLELNTVGGRLARGDSGLGDLRLWSRHTLWLDNAPGQTRRLAPFLGLELPTGRNDATDALGRLPRTLQLGSGSWDPFVGLVYTWQTLDWELDTSAVWQHNTGADGFRFGDSLRGDVSFQKRLWPRELSGGVPAFFCGVLETTLIWQDNNRAGGSRDPNSGGLTWYLTPGVQYVTRRWIAEAAVQLPVVRRSNGTALEPDFIVSAGFRINF